MSKLEPPEELTKRQTIRGFSKGSGQFLWVLAGITALVSIRYMLIGDSERATDFIIYSLTFVVGNYIRSKIFSSYF